MIHFYKGLEKDIRNPLKFLS